MPMDFLNKYDSLLPFIYREMDGEEARTVAENIAADFEMRQVLDEVLMGKMMLPKVQFNPAPASITNILNYSRLAMAA